MSNQNTNKMQCPRGHPYAGDNLYIDPAGYRRCRECKRLARQEGRWKEASTPSPYVPVFGPRRPNQNVLKSHCPFGHPYEGENLYRDPKGNRRCRECKRLARASLKH
jgi:hypothetical protein